jgi:hypothetical protein
MFDLRKWQHLADVGVSVGIGNLRDQAVRIPALLCSVWPDLS